MTSTILSTLQSDIAKRLARFPQFASLAILTERAKDFRGDVDRALAAVQPGRQSGLFLLIGTPTTATARQLPSGFNPKIIVAITCSEHVLHNMGPTGSKIPAADAAVDVLRILIGYTPLGCMRPLLPEDAPIRVIDDPFDPDRLCYLATLSTEVTYAPLRLYGEAAFVKGE
jgi:hypothetical protein